MEATIILNNIRLTLRDSEDPDTEIRHHDLDQGSTEKLLGLVKAEGLESTQFDDQLLELADDLVDAYRLQSAGENQYWTIEFGTTVSVDGLIGVSWEDL